MSANKTIEDLLAGEIKDLYSAEKQLIKAIPKMAKGSKDSTLQAAFLAHLKETETQVTRLEEAAKLLGSTTGGKMCVGMEGCIKEGAEALEQGGEAHVVDLGIIGAGSRVEHYEMAGYTTAIALAQSIGAKEIVTLLQKSLAEEVAAEEKLRSISSNLLKSAPTASKGTKTMKAVAG